MCDKWLLVSKVETINGEDSDKTSHVISLPSTCH